MRRWHLHRPPTRAANRSLYRRRHAAIIKHAGAGHTGGSLRASTSSTSSTTACCASRRRRFATRDRDRYIQSKGHSVEALFVVLADRGFFPDAQLETLCQYRLALRRPSDAQGAGHRAEHRRARPRPADRRRASRSRGRSTSATYRVFTLLGDGELAEGSNWEAAMAAAHYRARQPHRDRRPQHAPDHRPHARRVQQRAARRKVPRRSAGTCARSTAIRSRRS